MISFFFEAEYQNLPIIRHFTHNLQIQGPERRCTIELVK